MKQKWTLQLGPMPKLFVYMQIFKAWKYLVIRLLIKNIQSEDNVPGVGSPSVNVLQSCSGLDRAR